MEASWQMEKFQAWHQVLQSIFLRLWGMQISTSDNCKKSLQIRTETHLNEHVLCKSTWRWRRKEDNFWSLILDSTTREGIGN